MDEKKIYNIDTGNADLERTRVMLDDIKKTHEIVDALGFVVDVRYAPRKVPLDHIFHNIEHFQNRRKPYSEHSVQNIVDAVLDWSFDLRIFNPLILRRDNKTQKLYILWWHSRYEAFKRLSTQYKDNEKVQRFFEKHHYDFTKIPSLIMDDIQFNNAKSVALMSNALATTETDTERAEIYRSFRQLERDSKKIEIFGKKCEKSNRPRIQSYSWLNPNGNMMQSLEAYETGIDDSNIIKRIGLWIGNARKQHQELTNAHEEELYNWMMNKWWYGNQKGQMNSQANFLDVVGKHIERIKIQGLFNKTKPLNILNIKKLSFAMQKYYEMEKDIKRKKQLLYTEFHAVRRKINQYHIEKKTGEIQQIDDTLKTIIGQPISAADKMEQVEMLLFDVKEFVNDSNVLQVKKHILDTINAIEQEYYRHKKKKDAFIEAGKQELSLEF